MHSSQMGSVRLAPFPRLVAASPIRAVVLEPNPNPVQAKKIDSDAVEAVQVCSSEFLSFVASEARVKVRREGRSEVNEGDMLWALQSLGFKAFADALRGHMSQHYGLRGGGQPKASALGQPAVKRPRVAVQDCGQYVACPARPRPTTR